MYKMFFHKKCVTSIKHHTLSELLNKILNRHVKAQTVFSFFVKTECASTISINIKKVLKNKTLTRFLKTFFPKNKKQFPIKPEIAFQLN